MYLLTHFFLAGAPKGILSPEGDRRPAGGRGYGFAFLYPICPRAVQRKISPAGDDWRAGRAESRFSFLFPQDCVPGRLDMNEMDVYTLGAMQNYLYRWCRINSSRQGGIGSCSGLRRLSPTSLGGFRQTDCKGYLYTDPYQKCTWK